MRRTCSALRRFLRTDLPFCATWRFWITGSLAATDAIPNFIARAICSRRLRGLVSTKSVLLQRSISAPGEISLVEFDKEFTGYVLALTTIGPFKISGSPASTGCRGFDAHNLTDTTLKFTQTGTADRPTQREFYGPDFIGGCRASL